MIWFAFGIILAIVAIVGVIAAIWGASEGEGGVTAGGIATAVIAGALSVLMIFFLAGIREVPTKSVGVITQFGKVEGVLRPGIHHEGIFTHVNILDETIQTTTFEGNNALDVRIGGQQSAALDATIQWQIEDRGAATLFNEYNQNGSNIMGEITNAVVVRELKQAVNQVLGDYNPIQDVAANATAGNSQFSTFAPKVKKIMQSDMNGRVRVISVLMPFLHYDASTQARLNQIQAQYAETAIAQQQIATNRAQSEANAAIAKSVTSGPGVLEQECLTIVQQAVKTGASLPAGFTCLGGSNFTVTGK